MSLVSIPANGNKRVIIKNVRPTVEEGRYAAKAIIQQPIHFSAVIISDGNDTIVARVLYKTQRSKKWIAIPLTLEHNDHWHCRFTPQEVGLMEFKIEAWISPLATWKSAFEKKIIAQVDTEVEAQIGYNIINDLQAISNRNIRKLVQPLLSAADKKIDPNDIDSITFEALSAIAPPESSVSEVYKIDVERTKAGFSTWYELFPRSCSEQPGAHGTFYDVIRKLPSIAAAGFDVLYMPPIHPIGEEKRKGQNNSLTALLNDPGSPWAIGSKNGGHKSIHPELGTLEDFIHLLQEAKKLGIEIAMDIAFQCAPDHPYVKQSPQWFKWRPDGTVQYAENPPKKYEDILPFNFETDDWQALWQELLSIIAYWAAKGVRIFRIDNPHTKPLKLWEWIIKSIRTEHPDVIFLAEAFTRPNVLEHLAKAGFTQSYTYFTWRETAAELKEYMMELTHEPKASFLRPNFWPNTPDILPKHLTLGGEPMHIIRLILAATLSSNYGIYGPVFERCEREPMPDKEEYLNNEKYEIRFWPKVAPTLVWNTITTINGLRHKYKALQATNNVIFLESSNDQILAYLKLDYSEQNHLLVVVTLDPTNEQTGWIKLPYQTLIQKIGLPIELYDELNNETYIWTQEWNYIALHPQHKAAHILRITTTHQ